MRQADNRLLFFALLESSNNAETALLPISLLGMEICDRKEDPRKDSMYSQRKPKSCISAPTATWGLSGMRSREAKKSANWSLRQEDRHTQLGGGYSETRFACRSRFTSSSRACTQNHNHPQRTRNFECNYLKLGSGCKDRVSH